MMKLLYFTHSYPYGLGEQWKENELKELVNYFESVTVVPFTFGGNFSDAKVLPDSVNLKGPLFETDSFRLRKSNFLKIVVSRFVVKFFLEFFERKVYRNKKHIISWVQASMNVIRLSKHPLLKELLSQADKNTVLYFYWGKGTCEILPFIDTNGFYKTFVRMHRFDLFEHENRNYIPYRRILLESATIVAPSSLAGKRHLETLYPASRAKINLIRCGTRGIGKLAAGSTDNVFRVVSCSYLSPVKRVHIMINSLQFVRFPIMWFHIGDGVLRHDLETLAVDLNVSEKFVFTGMMGSNAVLDFYSSNAIDLFVNTSASEGVPFSIMEAFSAGIPVMATDVGGTREIVDDFAGKLLEEDVSPEKLADYLTDFYNKTPEERNIYRSEVYNRYQTYWNAEKLASELGMLLTS